MNSINALFQEVDFAMANKTKHMNVPPLRAASAGWSSAGRRGTGCRGGTWLGTAAAGRWGSAASDAAPTTTGAKWNSE